MENAKLDFMKAHASLEFRPNAATGRTPYAASVTGGGSISAISRSMSAKTSRNMRRRQSENFAAAAAIDPCARQEPPVDDSDRQLWVQGV